MITGSTDKITKWHIMGGGAGCYFGEMFGICCQPKNSERCPVVVWLHIRLAMSKASFAELGKQAALAACDAKASKDIPELIAKLSEAIVLINLSLERERIDSETFDTLSESRDNYLRMRKKAFLELQGENYHFEMISPSANLKDVIGNDDLKQFLFWTLKSVTSKPLSPSPLFERSTPKLFLLYGIPGIFIFN